MNNNEENNVEVIDPTDPRYKDEEHFHQNIQDDSKKISNIFIWMYTHRLWLHNGVWYFNVYFFHYYNDNLLAILISSVIFIIVFVNRKNRLSHRVVYI